MRLSTNMMYELGMRGIQRPQSDQLELQERRDRDVGGEILAQLEGRQRLDVRPLQQVPIQCPWIAKLAQGRELEHHRLEAGQVRDRDPVTARLRDLRARALAARPVIESETPSPIASLLATLGGFLPTGEDKEALQSGLVRAGIRASNASSLFLGAKVVGITD